MKKTYAVINTLVLLAVIFWNYWSNTGAINGNTVGEVSDQYENLFTPAGYAFSIWGLIYLGLLISVGYQLRLAFRSGQHEETILRMGPWFTIANLANGLWLWFWLQERPGASVLVMLVILFSLLMIVIRLNMERWDAPLPLIAAVWWPICIYSGWITLATIANVAAWLTSIGWVEVFTELQWTVIMICVAGLINLAMIHFRNMREFAAVGMWGLVAIAVRHWDQIPLIQWTAIAWAVVLAIVSAVQAFRNRHANPLRYLPFMNDPK